MESTSEDEFIFESDQNRNQGPYGVQEFVDKKKMNLAKKWTPEQNEKYIVLLKDFIEEVQTEKSRRQSKVFKKMSQRMNGVKSAEQFRGHHKKMLKKYGSVQQILEGLPPRVQTIKTNQRKRIPKLKAILSSMSSISVDEDYNQEQIKGIQNLNKSTRQEISNEEQEIRILEQILLQNSFQAHNTARFSYDDEDLFDVVQW